VDGLLEVLVSPSSADRSLRLGLVVEGARTDVASAHALLLERLAALSARLGTANPRSEAARLALGVILALHRVEFQREARL